MLDAEENSAQEHCMSGIPALGHDFFQRPQRADEASIVEGDIKPSELADCARHQGLDLGLGSDIGLVENSAATVFLALTHGGLAAFRVQVGNYNRRTFAGEAHGGRPAHPTCGPGYYRD